jgi:hypothetical protein
MPSTTHLRNSLRSLSGVTPIADFGLVHEGRIGYSHCKVSAGIELWQGMYFVWVSVVHQKNKAGKRTVVIKWPYSARSPADLEGVMADFQFIENLNDYHATMDNRGWLGRFFDGLIRCEYLGEYSFSSPLDEGPSASVSVVAKVVRMGGQREVSLMDGQQSGIILQTQFPHAACACIRQALSTYASSLDDF